MKKAFLALLPLLWLAGFWACTGAAEKKITEALESRHPVRVMRITFFSGEIGQEATVRVEAVNEYNNPREYDSLAISLQQTIYRNLDDKSVRIIHVFIDHEEKNFGPVSELYTRSVREIEALEEAGQIKKE
jgi:hypothetical protein